VSWKGVVPTIRVRAQVRVVIRVEVKIEMSVCTACPDPLCSIG